MTIERAILPVVKAVGLVVMLAVFAVQFGLWMIYTPLEFFADCLLTMMRDDWSH